MANSPKRLGESELIRRYFAPLCHPDMSFGLSDDAAFLRCDADQQLVLTKDMLVADVHFFADDDPALIARKALRVNLSDLASKGAEPLGYLLGLGLPTSWDEDWLKRFCEGLQLDQESFAFPLIGGDTVKSPERLTLSITAFGQVPRSNTILRMNAAVGEVVYVTGTIGDSALGLLVRREPDQYPSVAALDRAFLKDRFLLPQPRLSCRQLIRKFATASMDISDGLIGDAQKMSSAAGKALLLDSGSIPLSQPAKAMIGSSTDLHEIALTGGDDYELLFCARPEDHEALMAEAHSLGVSLSRIGRVAEGEGVRLLDSAGQDIPLSHGSSYEHF
ncbi:thiamine-phosphate kinase [Cohaesibacter haloalkalitolerans]|uniref:thiamine-phosphate kinase n=1 Tax=Cohaesibacter haloalkalitolerans TaxID=1162980 RepID=UPI000E64978A|nr:thiamine-phosphate kinase [Cohaesibacter haloalkalitolerans]